MSREELVRRARALIAGAAVASSRPAAGGDAGDEPDDLAALWSACDGLDLADGTRILGRAEAAAATAWLVDDKSLDWAPELLVIGERDDVVIVHDADRRGARARGGVLEAPTDALSSFRRAAQDAVAYVELRATGSDPSPVPERLAREAIASGDAEKLATAIARGFYPGADRDLAQAALRLGALRAGAGDPDRAMAAFTLSVEARSRSAPRGAVEAEAAAAWRAAAIAAEKAGAPAIAATCRARAGRVSGNS